MQNSPDPIDPNLLLQISIVPKINEGFLEPEQELFPNGWDHLEQQMLPKLLQPAREFQCSGKI
jgi:hypothetical protein